MKVVSSNTYQWNPDWANRIVHTADVNKVVAELEAIQETRGKLLPEYLVESSKNKKSLLHSFFEWDNDKAAHKWRVQQASELLRHIEVKVVSDGKSRVLRVYEISKRNNLQGGSELKRFDQMSQEDLEKIKSYCVSDLGKIKKRLIGYEITEAIEFIDKAIEVLSKKEAAKELSVIPPVAV